MRYLLFLLCLTAACRPTKRVVEERVVRDTIREVKYRDRLVEVPTAFTDTFIQWETLEVEKPVYIQDESGQARLKIWRDKYNQLLAECQSNPDPIIVTDTFYKEVTKYESENTQETVKKRNRWGWAEWLLGGLLLAAGIWAYLKNRKR